jgi:hypothetical protein
METADGGRRQGVIWEIPAKHCWAEAQRRGKADMARTCWLMTVVVVSLLPIGCDRPAATESPETPAADVRGSVHIERSEEGAAVLAQLGRKSWVFKHRGGELTAEWIVYHRPAGKNQKDTAVLEARGDQAVLILHAPVSYDPKNADTAGYLIVAMPSTVSMSEGDLTFNFSLGGAGCSYAAKASEVYPKTALSNPFEQKWGGNLLDKPLALAPGETKVLVDYVQRFGSPSAQEPMQELETVRHVLKVTALKNGELPKRERDRENAAP